MTEDAHAREPLDSRSSSGTPDDPPADRSLHRVDTAPAAPSGAPPRSSPTRRTPTPPTEQVKPAPTPPPVWDQTFAIAAAAALAVVALVLVLASRLLSTDLAAGASSNVPLDGRALVGNRVIGPVVVLGIVVSLAGVWMAMTEWRGRFAPRAEEPDTRGLPPVDVPKVIDAMGRLTGAALVLVTGIVILLAAAWMTSSTAGAEPATAPSGSTATPAATPTVTVTVRR
jgi:hypothetical protein